MSDGIGDAIKAEREYNEHLKQLNVLLEHLKNPTEYSESRIIKLSEDCDSFYFYFAPFLNDGSRYLSLSPKDRGPVVGEFLQQLVSQSTSAWAKLIIDISRLSNKDLELKLNQLSPFSNSRVLIARYWDGELEMKDIGNSILSDILQTEKDIKRTDTFLVSLSEKGELTCIKHKKASPH